MSAEPLTFAEYVASRKGEAAARLREGAAYAYGGDLRVRSTLDRMRPVALALEAALRFWQTGGKARVLGSAVRVGERQFPRVHAVLGRCVEALQIPMPALYISPELKPLEVRTFGQSDDSAIVLGAALVDHLGDDELGAVIGHECGAIQNNHTGYMTALYVLANAANLVVRWAVQPAVLALRGWGRRADITRDRASLICTRDVRVTTSALVKVAFGSRTLYSAVNVDEYLQQLAEQEQQPGRFTELFADHPHLPKRVAALRLFAETTFYKSLVGGPGGAAEPGITKEECDAKVGELLSVL